MNISFGLRQLFYYLLPGFLNILLYLLAVSVGIGKIFEAPVEKIIAVAGTSSGIILSAIAFSLCAICGLLSSGGVEMVRLLFYNRFFESKIDPRILSLLQLPKPLLDILSESKKNPKWQAKFRSVFYYVWGILKLKVDQPLEFALASNYAMNFAARVFFGSVSSLALALTIKAMEGTFLSWHKFEVVGIIFIALITILSAYVFNYYNGLWCRFSVHLFTAFYQLDLNAEQKVEVMEHFLKICGGSKREN